MQCNILVTPVSKKARFNYEVERQFFVSGSRNPMWNDSPRGLTEIGDLFGFVHVKENRVEVFAVENVQQNPPSEWNTGKEWNRGRRVLVLSRLREIKSWDSIKQESGWHPNRKLLGSCNLRLNKYPDGVATLINDALKLLESREPSVQALLREALTRLRE